MFRVYGLGVRVWGETRACGSGLLDPQRVPGDKPPACLQECPPVSVSGMSPHREGRPVSCLSPHRPEAEAVSGEGGGDGSRVSSDSITFFLLVQGSGFRVQGSGFWVQGSGFRGHVVGFRAQGLGFAVEGLGFGVWDFGRTLKKGFWRSIA